MHKLFRISVLCLIFINFSKIYADISYDFTDVSNGINKKERLDNLDKKIEQFENKISALQSEQVTYSRAKSELAELKSKLNQVSEELTLFKARYQRDRAEALDSGNKKLIADPIDEVANKQRVLTSLDLIEIQDENNRLKDSIKSIRKENAIILEELKSILLKLNGEKQNKLGK